MAETITETGRIIKCTDMGFINGRMAEGIKAIINTIKRKGLVSIFGLMAKDFKEHGLMAKDKVLAKLSISLGIKKLAYGKMIRK